jgi:2-dehydro-3-deoxyphosphooctonate aldolase (KDO 8-P synthase)
MKSTISFFNNLRDDRFFLIAGPCVVENDDMPFSIAEHLLGLCAKYDVPLLFKASYKKANRSRNDSFTGIGDMKALKILKRLGEQFNLPVVTDIHSVEEAYLAADFVDVLQIPAFLCRQTELLVAAAKTGKVVNIKKGQFLSGQAMHHAAEKVLQAGNSKIILTERGNTFGYHDLVVDFRNIAEMQSSGYPVVVDITHSLQQPNQASGVTGGQPALIGLIGNAAIASGADGLFLETHPSPKNALSDGANMLQIDLLEKLLSRWVRIREAVV